MYSRLTVPAPQPRRHPVQLSVFVSARWTHYRVARTQTTQVVFRALLVVLAFDEGAVIVSDCKSTRVRCRRHLTCPSQPTQGVIGCGPNPARLAGFRVGDVKRERGGRPSPGKAISSATTRSFTCMVIVSSLTTTLSSGICRIQKRPFGAIPGLKSCTCDPELGSKKSSHISIKVPRATADIEPPAPPLTTAPAYFP